MHFELWQLFLAGVGYLLLLFVIAYAAERGWIPRRIARHPATYVLSLGVYATSWTFYGSVGFAQQQGYNFLTIYLGVTLAFLLAPVLLQPLLRLSREYQLASLADVFAFRYQSQLAGVLVTLFMLTGALPYIALQVRAVTESLQVMTSETAPAFLAFGFCLTITLFAILFGARHISARERHEGLVVAIAFESLVKLTALLAIGLFAVYGVFGGLDEMNRWLGEHPETLHALYQPVREGPWASLLLLSFAAAFLLPRQFHMAFTENVNAGALSVASWAFPLFLLLLNLAIPPILWAGTKLAPATSADFYGLGITLASGSRLLPVLTFVGGISAASAMIIVTTLALAAMCMNHLVLPASFPPRLTPQTNIYRWLLWGRRVLIAVIILAGFGFYLLLEANQGLAQLGLISFVAVAQFLPGIVGLLYWRRATRAGFISGLLAGGTVWSLALMLPLLDRSGLTQFGVNPKLFLIGDGRDPWTGPTLWTLGLNTLLFVTVSLVTRQSRGEEEAAVACCKESLAPPRGVLALESVQQMEEHLSRITGTEMARHEVNRALGDLGLVHTELTAGDLRHLRERIERNLSGLVGPLLARMIVDDQLQMEQATRTALADSVRFIEQHLEKSQTRLRGLAAELDALRRYHRQVLQDLPMGVCSVSADKTVLNWNTAMAELSGLPAARVLGHKLGSLEEPWSGLLDGFLLTGEQQLRKIQLRVGRQMRVFNLHKAAIDDPTRILGEEAGTVVLVEDLTDLHTLEAELAHSERLASIGRLAAGVAHEIGNPVTAIACLAQDLKEDIVETQVAGQLEQVLEQTRRIGNIVQSLVSFSHSGTVYEHNPSRLNPCRVIDEAVKLVRLSHGAKQLEFINRCDEAIEIEGDRQRLTQVFVNLLSNASDASAPGDTIELNSRIDEGYVAIEVIDHGHGIPEELWPQVFDPFFTTKQPGEGTGLGLPLVFNIIQEHSGSLSLHSEPGHTVFTVQLPLAGEPQTTEEQQQV